MNTEEEIKAELSEQRDTLRRWIAVQSVLGAFFLINVAVTLYLGYSSQQGTILDTMVILSTISFLALGATFITSGSAAGKIKKLVQQLKDLPAQPGEEPQPGIDQDSSTE